MKILPKYVHFNGLKLSGASEDFFFHFTMFGLKYAKINFLKKIRVLSAVFLELKYR